MRHVRVLSLVALVVCTGAVPRAFAQAWVPPGGVGTVNVTFQSIANTGHRDADGTMIRGFDSSSRTLAFDFDYAFTDRLSVAFGVPLVAAKYTGPEPSFFPLPIDDCLCWNTDWQDFGLTARYNLVNGILAVTPSVSFGTPTHSYDDIGEAAVGRNLTETAVRHRCGSAARRDLAAADGVGALRVCRGRESDRLRRPRSMETTAATVRLKGASW